MIFLCQVGDFFLKAWAGVPNVMFFFWDQTMQLFGAILRDFPYPDDPCIYGIFTY